MLLLCMDNSDLSRGNAAASGTMVIIDNSFCITDPKDLRFLNGLEFEI